MKGKRRNIVSAPLAALLLCVPCTLQAQARDAAPAVSATVPGTAIDALFTGFVAGSTPGASVAIYKSGALVYSSGYGTADLEAGTPVTTQTRFHVASVSKQFTAFAIALLAREGKVDLDADIRRYLPYVPDFGPKITVRHLLLHTSGLRDQWSLFELGGQDMHNVLRQQQVLNMVSQQKALNFAPGSEHVYCNTGYTLLAEIVRAVSGKSLRDFAQERIFAPLGMTHSFFFDDVTMIVPGRAQSYERDATDKPWKRDLLNYDLAGATSLLTTPEDLMKWAANFAQPRVGDRALIEQISHNGALDDGTPINYGFGLVRTTLGGRTVVQHSGADAGFRAIITYYPEQDFAVAITTGTPVDPGNAAGFFDFSGKVDAIANLFLPPVKVAPAPVSPIDAGADVRPYAGRFMSPFEPSVRLTVDQTGLHLMMPGVGQAGLVMHKDGRLRIPGPSDWSSYSFAPLRDTGGYVTGFERHGAFGEPVVRYKRVEPVALSPAQLVEFAGRYQSDELQISYTLTVDGDHLSARSLWSTQPILLSPLAGDRFESADWNFAVTLFDRDPRGKIIGLHLDGDRIRNVAMRRVDAAGAAPFPPLRN